MYLKLLFETGVPEGSLCRSSLALRWPPYRLPSGGRPCTH